MVELELRHDEWEYSVTWCERAGLREQQLVTCNHSRSLLRYSTECCKYFLNFTLNCRTKLSLQGKNLFELWNILLTLNCLKNSDVIATSCWLLLTALSLLFNITSSYSTYLLPLIFSSSNFNIIKPTQILTNPVKLWKLPRMRYLTPSINPLQKIKDHDVNSI